MGDRIRRHEKTKGCRSADFVISCLRLRSFGSQRRFIPFAGANPAALSLLGGHIEAITVSAAEVYPHVAAGKLKILGVMSDRLQASLGAEALRYSILYGLGFYLLSAVVYGTAALRLEKDWHRT